MSNGPWTGNFCPNCGGPHMLRTGTCETCQDCGTNTGCSRTVRRGAMLCAVLALCLCACASSLDAASTAHNLRNVEQIAADQADVIGRAGDKVAPSEAAAMKARNDAAVKLAKAMAESAK